MAERFQRRRTSKVSKATPPSKAAEGSGTTASDVPATLSFAFADVPGLLASVVLNESDPFDVPLLGVITIRKRLFKPSIVEVSGVSNDQTYSVPLPAKV
jgi:hypothetical protein